MLNLMALSNHFKPEKQEYYICSTYRKDRTLCKMHSICRVVPEEIVLRNLRETEESAAPCRPKRNRAGIC